jgi:WD40 repeat protein
MKVKLDFKCKLIFSETSRRLIYLCRKESKSKALNFQKQQINEEDDSFKAMINEKNESIPTFDEIRCKLDTKITEFSLMQYEHFAKIKNDIDIKRETLLEEVTKKSKITATINLERYIEDIHRTSAQMISQVEMAEDSFRRNFNLSKKFLTNNESKNTDDEEKLKLIEKKLKNFKLFEYDLLRNKFTPYSYELIATFDSKTFGRLELFDDFVQKIDGNDDDIYSYEILNVATSFTRLFGRNEIQILNLNTKSIVKELSGHLGVVFCLIAHGSTKLISGSEDKTIRIWVELFFKLIKKFFWVLTKLN